MLGVEEPIHLRRASLVSEIYSEAEHPLQSIAELTDRGRRKKSSSTSTGIANFGTTIRERITNSIITNCFN
jgi:hypothetical protein